MEGAAAARRDFAGSGLENACNLYAAARNLLYRKGRIVETLVCYEPAFAAFFEWWKQLFGESEGKNKKGVFPASLAFSTDLHSMGQYMQEGLRIMFETVVRFGAPASDIAIPREEGDFDGLNYLAGSSMSYINDMAAAGTILAHTGGEVPCLTIEAGGFDEYSAGELIYFFERACGVSAYMLGVNPFNQPGVESYKKNMFALLGKPGFEELRRELELKIDGHK
jgi:glucose-6-phosphate isomerase